MLFENSIYVYIGFLSYPNPLLCLLPHRNHLCLSTSNSIHYYYCYCIYYYYYYTYEFNQWWTCVDFCGATIGELTSSHILTEKKLSEDINSKYLHSQRWEYVSPFTFHSGLWQGDTSLTEFSQLLTFLSFGCLQVSALNPTYSKGKIFLPGLR